jgi:hypothetical protein
MTNPLTWNVSANKLYELGIDRGVVYLKTAGAYPLGFEWEGLVNLTEKPGGAEITDLYANNVKYSQLQAVETFEGSIEAFTYPDVFLQCDGTLAEVTGSSQVLLGQQPRVGFGLSYRTWLGNDADGQTNDYKIHLIYGCLAKPSEVARATINDSPEALNFSWEFQTTPVAATGYNAVSKITIIASELTATDLTAIEEALYGDGVDDPYLPLPDVLIIN